MAEEVKKNASPEEVKKALDHLDALGKHAQDASKETKDGKIIGDKVGYNPYIYTHKVLHPHRVALEAKEVSASVVAAALALKKEDEPTTAKYYTPIIK